VYEESAITSNSAHSVRSLLQISLALQELVQLPKTYALKSRKKTNKRELDKCNDYSRWWLGALVDKATIVARLQRMIVPQLNSASVIIS